MAINQDCCDLVRENFGQFCSKKVCISTMNTVLPSTCLTVHKRLPWLQINLYSNFEWFPRISHWQLFGYYIYIILESVLFTINLLVVCKCYWNFFRWLRLNAYGEFLLILILQMNRLRNQYFAMVFCSVLNHFWTNKGDVNKHGFG